MAQHFTVGGYPNPDPHYISPEEEAEASAAAADEKASNDAERLDWLEGMARQSQTGISFDWVPPVDDEPSGFRFLRRFFIGDAKRDIRAAIDAAMAASK